MLLLDNFKLVVCQTKESVSLEAKTLLGPCYGRFNRKTRREGNIFKMMLKHQNEWLNPSFIEIKGATIKLPTKKRLEIPAKSNKKGKSLSQPHSGPLQAAILPKLSKRERS